MRAWTRTGDWLHTCLKLSRIISRIGVSEFANRENHRASVAKRHERTTGASVKSSKFLHAPDFVVRFAIESHLDAQTQAQRGAGDRTGRQLLGDALGLDSRGTSVLLSTNSRLKLWEASKALEVSRLAPLRSVTRLALQVRLPPAQGGLPSGYPTPYWSIGESWWPSIRDASHLGDDDAPRFRSAADVVLAAEAFGSHYAHLVQQPPNNPLGGALAPREMEACSQLLAKLCWLGSGPFGVAHDALRLVAALAPLNPEIVVDSVGLGGPRSQMVRALDRSLRHSQGNAHIRHAVNDLLASPPEKIFRRVYWLRALRGVRLHDFQNGDGDRPLRNWVYEQLRFAVRGELGYRGARLTDRRYALWCLAELEADEADWQRDRLIATEDDGLSDLLPLCEELRQHIARTGVRDAFLFTPPRGWPVIACSKTVAERLDATFTDSSRWSQAETWRWMRPQTRSSAIRYLRDALLAPCAVRQRAATDVLRSCSALTQESASITVGEILQEEWASTAPSSALIERCLVVLGTLHRRRSIRLVEDVVQTASTDEILGQAISVAGDLAHANPADSVGLMAWTQARAAKSSDEEVAIAAIHAAVAYRQEPRGYVGERAADRNAVQLMLRWADEVLVDPLLPPRGATQTAR